MPSKPYDLHTASAACGKAVVVAAATLRGRVRPLLPNAILLVRRAGAVRPRANIVVTPAKSVSESAKSVSRLTKSVSSGANLLSGRDNVLSRVAKGVSKSANSLSICANALSARAKRVSKPDKGPRVPYRRPVNLSGHQFNPPKMEVLAYG